MLIANRRENIVIERAIAGLFHLFTFVLLNKLFRHTVISPWVLLPLLINDPKWNQRITFCHANSSVSSFGNHRGSAKLGENLTSMQHRSIYSPCY